MMSIMISLILTIAELMRIKMMIISMMILIMMTIKLMGIKMIMMIRGKIVITKPKKTQYFSNNF